MLKTLTDATQSLKDCYHYEEEIVSILTRLYNNDNELGIFSTDERKKIKELLTIVNNDEKRHLLIIKEMFSEMEK